MRIAPVITLTARQRDTLIRHSNGRSVSVRLAQRARIVLLAAAGKQDLQIAAELGITRQKAARWRQRYLAAGVAGIERDAPRPGKALHLIVDNDSTHKHVKVKSRLSRHPRFHIHFTPTRASWLNTVERFFRDLTCNRLRRGLFKGIPERIGAIEGYIKHHNQHPKPFIWTAKAADVLEKVKGAQATLNKLQTA